MKWIEFVKAYAKKNNIKYGEALKKAAPEYRKMKGSSSKDEKPKKKKKMKKGKK